MSKKKLEVVELNKKEEKIILDESPSAIILFWRKYRSIMFLLLLTLSLTVLGTSLFLFIRTVSSSDEPIIKKASIESNLSDFDIISINHSLDDDAIKDLFNKNGKFKDDGEVLLVKKVENNRYTILFYSDSSAIRISKDGSQITRISSVDGNYGISKDGSINIDAKTSSVNATSTKDYAWGKVTFLSDGSAIISDSKLDMFVRNSSDIFDNFISNNKVSYLKEIKNIGNIKLNYYCDGTIEIIKNGTSYVVRRESNLNITNNDVIFKNNNEATIYKTIKTNEGLTIDYYTDGGAIIRDGTKTISVRKSNSIIIKDNDVYEIVDNIYVTISKKTTDATYYTNGGAVVRYNGKSLYISDNSNIKNNSNKTINSIDNDIEELTKESNVDNENVKIFTKTGVITTNEYIAIVPKDSIIYNTDGKVKEIKKDEELDDIKSFTITNNTNSDLKYRVVIEESPKTTVDAKYIKYQLKTNNDNVKSKNIIDAKWPKDNLAKTLGVTKPTYILYEGTIPMWNSENFNLMFWFDYKAIGNNQMEKYFYGTIKVYAWSEEEK